MQFSPAGFQFCYIYQELLNREYGEKREVRLGRYDSPNLIRYQTRIYFGIYAVGITFQTFQIQKDYYNWMLMLKS